MNTLVRAKIVSHLRWLHYSVISRILNFSAISADQLVDSVYISSKVEFDEHFLVAPTIFFLPFSSKFLISFHAS